MAGEATCPVRTGKSTDTGQEISGLVPIAGTTKTVTLDPLPGAWLSAWSADFPVCP